MKTRLRLTLALSLIMPVVALTQDADDGKAPAGPPPMPLYQAREPVPDGDRLDTPATGEVLYSNRCGYCHLPGGMGTNMLTVQRMQLGEPPERGLLTNRDDLPPDYVRTVVRTGKAAMPRLTQVDVTDSELELIADYLAGDGQ